MPNRETCLCDGLGVRKSVCFGEIVSGSLWLNMECQGKRLGLLLRWGQGPGRIRGLDFVRRVKGSH